MVTHRCPHCQMPLGEMEALGPRCPLCKGVLNGGGALKPSASPAQPKRRRSLRGLLALAALALVLGGTLYWALNYGFSKKLAPMEGDREEMPAPTRLDAEILLPPTPQQDPK